MKYLCTILLICGLYMGQVWGQDTDDEALIFQDPGQGWNFVFDGPTTISALPHLLIYIAQGETDPLQIPLAIGLDGEIFTLSEIRAILERCREFVAPPPDYSTTYAVYRTRLGELEYQIELEKERLAKEERKEQLRRAIEMLPNRLTFK